MSKLVIKRLVEKGEEMTVKTWNTSNAGEEKCKKCGTIYNVTVTRLPVRDSDSFKCEKCGELINQWNSTHSYNYELKK